MRACALFLAGVLVIPLASALPQAGTAVQRPNLAVHLVLGAMLPTDKCLHLQLDPPAWGIGDCPEPLGESAQSAGPTFAAYACVAVFIEDWPIYSDCPSVAV